MSVKGIIILVFVIVILMGIALNAWKMMRSTDRMLDDIDKDKLKDLSQDDWEK